MVQVPVYHLRCESAGSMKIEGLSSGMRTSILVIAVTLSLPTASPLHFTDGSGVTRSWRRRGVYKGRTDVRTVEEVAADVGIGAPWTAPAWVWKTAWRVGHKALPVLHKWDRAAPADTCVNLWVCWLKAIAGKKGSQGGYAAEALAYELLPHGTRRVVSRPLAWLYPPLHHQNVALRSAFLDRETRRLLREADRLDSAVVVLGSGFDTRALRLGEEEEMKRSEAGDLSRVLWAEIDLPAVVGQKRLLLERLVRRRPEHAARVGALSLHGANLTRTEEARGAIRCALASLTARNTSAAHVVFVLEALLIYLPDISAAELLRAAHEEATAAGATHVSLAFADRLPGFKGSAIADGRQMLEDAGWILDESTWLPKPGLARHSAQHDPAGCLLERNI